MRFFAIFIFLLVLVGVGYGFWKYFFIYSEGNREGILYKFSTKGTIFKTNEGQLLLPGVVPNMQQLSNNYFYFSSIDPVITKKLERNIGKKINVHYIQYNGSLPWRGDNYDAQNTEDGQYIVDEVNVIGEPDQMGMPAAGQVVPASPQTQAYPQQVAPPQQPATPQAH